MTKGAAGTDRGRDLGAEPGSALGVSDAWASGLGLRGRCQWPRSRFGEEPRCPPLETILRKSDLPILVEAIARNGARAIPRNAGAGRWKSPELSGLHAASDRGHRDRFPRIPRDRLHVRYPSAARSG